MQLRALVLVFALLATFITVARGQEKRIPLEYPFVLADADGKTVSSDDFPEKFLLIYFGYTHCADQCPTALSAMAEALAEIGPAADYIQPLFVTVDPERDHGATLNEFTAAFDKRLVGLTGSLEQIAAAAETLGIEYRKVLAGNEDYVIDHSSVLSLIGLDRRNAVTFAFAEPYMVAAKLIEELGRNGVALRDVNNLRAYR
jgi:cytochrome oxidase Cu insertion factor (SCO1/SenC/PrrC family)